jgi:bla regulator protein blaR1
MNNLLLYFFKMSAGTILFYICYLLFFRNDTFYKRNRSYLILNLLLPALLPLLNLTNLNNRTGSVSKNTLNEILLTGNNLGTAMSDRLAAFDFSTFLIWFYFLISGILLVRFIISLAKTSIIIKKGTVKGIDFPGLIISELQHPPFSFYPYVVIPRDIYESGNYKEILDHEYAHIRQRHTFDLLLSELFIVFQWFNPFIWLIKRSMVLNHEYLADKVSLKNSGSKKEYQYKLLHMPVSIRSVPLAHNFSSLIKNRIVMINKKPTNSYAALKSLLILPAVMILFIAFSFKANPQPQPAFSEDSKSQLFKFILEKIKYPSEAKEASVTGKFFVVVKILKGGKIETTTIKSDEKVINVPILDEIVIVGYGPISSSAATGSSSKELALITNEGIRVAKMLGSIDLPEWKDKNMEFALAFNFKLENSPN